MDDRHESDEAAEDEMSRRETIPLSARASRALIESYLNPREPNAALIRARKRHAVLIVADKE